MELTLTLAGLMQAYTDTPQPFTNRRTMALPTNSAIYGIIERAMGIKRVNDIRVDLFKAPSGKEYHIEKDVYVHRDRIQDLTSDEAKKHRIMTDDQTVGKSDESSYFISADGKKLNEALPLVKKEYLVNCRYKVVIEGEDELITCIKDYLQHPIYPIYLGRYCCIPSEPIIQDQ